MRILIVDDQPSIAHFLRAAMEGEGYEVRTAATGADAIAEFERDVPDVVLLDLKLPDASGLDLLVRFKEIEEAVTVIMMTAFGEVETAVRAMKNGAADFLTKPVNLEQVRLLVAKALERQALWRELRHHRSAQSKRLIDGLIRGESARMREVFSIVERVAHSDMTSVLIEGESGTGKQVVACLIHTLSSRKKHPFVELNCAAIPSELLETELFGHEKGAFTDAKAQKAGLLETADGGTLFLDEVGEMSLPLQVKLLKVLEGMTFRRVGGNRDISVNVRVVSATNRNLQQLCDAGRFREDLYFRLKVVPLTVPPLRERGDDVLLFAKHFLHTFTKQFGKQFRRIHPDAEKKLLAYPWPGNIRELRNLFERTVLLEDSEELRTEHLALESGTARDGREGFAGSETRMGPRLVSPSADTESARLLRRLSEIFRLDGSDDGSIDRIEYEALVGAVERELILAACEATGWNQSRTAELLRLGRDKLRYRMKLHGISARTHRLRPGSVDHDDTDQAA